MRNGHVEDGTRHMTMRSGSVICN